MFEGAPRIPETIRESANPVTVLNREAQGALLIETLPEDTEMDQHWEKWVEGGKESIAEVFRKAVDLCLEDDPQMAEQWVMNDASHPEILERIKSKMLEIREEPPSADLEEAA